MYKFPVYAAAFILAIPSMAGADQVISDDLVVIGSGCVGFDCSDGMVFGQNDLVMRENNDRITFESDGVSTFSLVANESTNGGDSEFRIDSPENVAGSWETSSSGSLSSVLGDVQLDGRLRVSTDYYYLLGIDFEAGSPELDVTDARNIEFDEDYFYVAAGDYAGAGPLYTINNGATITAEDGSAMTGSQDMSVARITFSADGNAVTLGRGSVAEDDAVSVGSSGATRQIKNLADAINAQDLITLRQITSTADGLGTRLDMQESELNEVSAMTMALSALQPNPRATGPFSLSVGLGLYEDEQAVALGGLWSINKNTFVRLAASKAGDSDMQASISMAMGW